MFDGIPAGVCLFLILAIVALAPARYVVMHVIHAPARRDITQPAEDLSWRSTRALLTNLSILAGLAALATVVAMGVAADVARSMYFPPTLFAGFAIVALWTVFKGYRTGAVEPLVRGTSWTFERAECPKRYWASMAWNALLGVTFVAMSGLFATWAPNEARRDQCHQWEGRPPADALAACNRLLAEQGDDDRASLFASRGSAYFRQGKYRQAEADYAAAIRLDPEDATSRNNLGLVYERLGDPARATAAYSAALRTDPKNIDAYINRGVVALNSGRAVDAIADFTRAHELKPADITSLANRGMAYAWKDDVVRATRDFAVVRKTDPKNQFALHGEGVMAFRSGDYEAAARLFSLAISQVPDDSWALGMRARTYERIGDRDRMRVDLAEVSRLERGTDDRR